MRPEAERKLRAGFQRRADEQAGRYAAQLAHAELRLADGQTREISRSLQNARDPYQEMGQLFRNLAPGTVGKTMPKFPTIDEILAACCYACTAGRRSLHGAACSSWLATWMSTSSRP